MVKRNKDVATSLISVRDGVKQKTGCELPQAECGAQGAEGTLRATPDVLPPARCSAQMTPDMRRAPLSASPETWRIPHWTWTVRHHARSGLHMPSGARQKPCCRARKTRSKGR